MDYKTKYINMKYVVSVYENNNITVVYTLDGRRTDLRCEERELFMKNWDNFCDKESCIISL